MNLEPERKYNIKLNAFEAGALTGMLYSDRNREQLKGLENLAKQLVDIQNEMRKEAGVTITVLDQNHIKLTDMDGTTIIREKYPWE